MRDHGRVLVTPRPTGRESRRVLVCRVPRPAPPVGRENSPPGVTVTRPVSEKEQTTQRISGGPNNQNKPARSTSTSRSAVTNQRRRVTVCRRLVVTE
eukprot:6709168-Prymnesium_polylepis.1